MPIRRLDDGYKVKTGEVETKDDLLLAYANSRFTGAYKGDVVVGFKRYKSQAIWIVKEPDNWSHVVNEWRAVRHIFEPFALEVGRLRSAVKNAL